MLLLTSLAFGGSDAIAAYDHLPVEEEELLRHRAQALVQIPREKRVPLLVQEIKRLFTQRRRQLASADPKRLAKVLRGERHAMVEVVLSAVSGEVADATRAELGLSPRNAKARDVRPEVLSVIRWKLEDALRQGGPQIGSFRFSDMLMLQQREIFAVADRMGARVLATAIAGLAEADRLAFLEKLPPDQRALATRAAEAGVARRLSAHDGKTVLEMYGALADPSAGLRSAGVQRVARACVAQSPEFAQRMVERHHGELGRLLQRWVREERSKQIKGDGGRLDIVEQLERLAQKSIIDRPVRLPPPMRPPPPPAPPEAREPSKVAAPPPPPPERTHTPQSKVLVPPPARRNTGGTGQNPAAGAPPRRSMELPKAEPKPAPRPPPPGLTDSQLRRRVLRDGKPLERQPGGAVPADAQDTRPPVRRPTSPVQPIPKRRETTGLPVPEGKGPSGRGPGGGSR